MEAKQMVKHKGDFNLIKGVLSKVMKEWKGTTKWTTDNTVVFTDRAKAEVGTIILEDLTAEIKEKALDDIWSKAQKLYEAKSKAVVTTALTNGSPMKTMLNNKTSYGGLDRKPEIVKDLIKELGALGIVDMKIGGHIQQTTSIKNHLTLHLGVGTDGNGTSIESGYFGRLKTFLFGKYTTKYKRKEDMNISEVNRMKNLEGEKSKKIEFDGMLIGEYYNERNLINIYYNPFLFQEYSLFDDTMPQTIIDILKTLKLIGVKKEDVSKVQEKIFVTKFLKYSRDKLENAKQRKKEQESQIRSYEQNIRQAIEHFNEHSDEVDFINQLLGNKGKGLYEEVKKVEKLKFVEKLEINGSQIDIKFKAGFLPVPNMMRYDSGKKFGKRYLWIGSVGFKITPGGFKVYGEVDVHNNHCHTHGSGFPEGSACFGSGEGRNKVYSLLACNKFVDLTKMLFFWTRTHVNEGAYVKVWSAYDDILAQGYPVFDDKGNRIEINEPDRLKSGEQVKLEKKFNYTANKKKFENIKLEA